jgi:hypothetical protein
MNTHLPPYWAQHVIELLGGPARNETNRFFHAWAQAEGGNATWNPLNSTFQILGSTDYNSVGVQNYSRPIWGICATAMTLTMPASGDLTYPGIVGDVQSGTHTAEDMVNRNIDEIKHWGTDPHLILEVLKTTTS